MSFRAPYRPSVSFSKFVLQRGHIIVFLIACLAYLLQDGSLSSLFDCSLDEANLENRICLDLHTKKPIATLAKYAIVIDAGSTGTRLHVYEFEYCNRKLFSLATELFKEIPIGMATLVRNLSAIEELIFHPLMDAAVNSVPADLLSCTPITVQATAGFRLLEASQATLILDEVRSILKRYPFRLGKAESNAVSIISGQDEGVWGWIAVNFLLHRIGYYRRSAASDAMSMANTAAIMDLGGASTQIVFEIDQKDMAYYRRNAPGSPYFYELSFGEKNYTLFQHSFLGYGLLEARKRAKGLFVAESLKGSKEAGLNQSFSCLPSAYRERMFDSSLSENATAAAADYDWLNGSDASLSAPQCRNWIMAAFEFDALCTIPPCSFAGVPHPPSFKSIADLYGFSYIYERIQPLFAQMPTLLTLDALWKVTESVCTVKNSTAHSIYTDALRDNAFYCMDLVYIHTLLSAAYGIQPAKRMNIVKKIDGFETAWTLGAAVDLLDHSPECVR